MITPSEKNIIKLDETPHKNNVVNMNVINKKINMNNEAITINERIIQLDI